MGPGAAPRAYDTINIFPGWTAYFKASRRQKGFLLPRMLLLLLLLLLLPLPLLLLLLPSLPRAISFPWRAFHGGRWLHGQNARCTSWQRSAETKKKKKTSSCKLLRQGIAGHLV